MSHMFRSYSASIGNETRHLTKSPFKACVPEYWMLISSPWSAHTAPQPQPSSVPRPSLVLAQSYLIVALTNACLKKQWLNQNLEKTKEMNKDHSVLKGVSKSEQLWAKEWFQQNISMDGRVTILSADNLNCTIPSPLC
jgi:hypothetical protein